MVYNYVDDFIMSKNLHKIKYCYLLSFVAVFGLCLCAVMLIINSVSRKIQLHSAYEALYAGIIVALDAYYENHDQYPESLDKLTEIDFCDGATPNLLKYFQYTSDGNSCEISYFSEFHGKEKRTCLIKGEFKWQ